MDLYNTYFAYDDSILMIDVKRVLKLFRVFHTHNNNNKGTGNTKVTTQHPYRKLLVNKP